MATLDEILTKLQAIQRELSDAIANAKLSPKQITIINGLSDINNSLGAIRAGEFLAFCAGDNIKNGSGSFMSADGIVTAGGLRYNVGGVLNGILKWGANSETGYLEAGAGNVLLSDVGLSVFNEAGTEIGRFGNLKGFLNYADNSDVYGIAIGTTDNYISYDNVNGLLVINASTTGPDWTEVTADSWQRYGGLNAIWKGSTWTDPYVIGTRIKFDLGGVTKYSQIEALGLGNNIAYLYGVTLTGDAITNQYFSNQYQPTGFPDELLTLPPPEIEEDEETTTTPTSTTNTTVAGSTSTTTTPVVKPSKIPAGASTV